MNDIFKALIEPCDRDLKRMAVVASVTALILLASCLLSHSVKLQMDDGAILMVFK
jgi:hypothetical protein